MRIACLFFLGWIAVAQAATLKPGQAAGTFTCNAMTVELYYSSTYVDSTIDGHPLVVILSNQKVPTEGWDDGSDFLKYRLHNPILGVAFWFDHASNVVRAAYFDKDAMPFGDLKLFDVVLDPGEGAGLAGSVRSTEAASKLKKPISLDATFRAPQ